MSPHEVDQTNKLFGYDGSAAVWRLQVHVYIKNMEFVATFKYDLARMLINM